MRAILVTPLLGLAVLMLVACARDEPRPQVSAPAPEVGARGNPGQDIDGLRRNIPITTEVTPLPMAQVENFDVRRGRAYPMQPPTIPHSIDGYQVDLNSNRCMLCHARSNAAQFQAPESAAPTTRTPTTQSLPRSRPPATSAVSATWSRPTPLPWSTTGSRTSTLCSGPNARRARSGGGSEAAASSGRGRPGLLAAVQRAGAAPEPGLPHPGRIPRRDRVLGRLQH